MGRVLTIEDFKTEEYRISVNPPQEVQLNALIDKVENEYLGKMFGKDLRDLFFADLDSNKIPQTARFTILFEPLMEQNDSIMLTSIGIKEMLMSFVYFYWTRTKIAKLTTVDVSTSVSENSNVSSANKLQIIEKYNTGIDTLITNQYYMSRFNEIDYPEYKGVCVDFAPYL